ncbi:MAG: peptidylprolyl isomerase [Bacteroidota bacterium]
MKLLKSLMALLFVGMFFLVGCSESASDPTLPDGLYAKIQTKYGDIVCRLEHERAPLTVANFVALVEGDMENTHAEAGQPFYDGLTFHRVMSNFMIQGGDPQASGMGGPGYAFKDEFHPDLKHNIAGTLSMANAGINTNGSQFFITHNATPWLDNKHSVFGYVTDGLPIVFQVQQSDTIQRIQIIRNGAEAESFDAVKTFEELK